MTSTKDWRAHIEVFAGQRARQPVSRLLYGKFCEHLGANIYNGMWAQILRNPGFEPWHLLGGEKLIAHRIEGIERRLGIKGLEASRKRGIAFPWIACGQGDASFALDRDAFNSETSQRITVASVPKGGCAGVAQPICLPLHRIGDYDLSLAARSKGKVDQLLVTIRQRAPDGVVLARQAIPSIGSSWEKRRLRLSVPKDRVGRGEVLFFCVTLPKPGTVWLDNIELFPCDHIDGFDPDVVRLWREARLPLLRYPGGNFASGYHWQDGVGPRGKRRTTLNRPWNQPEPNHVGTDEFIAFCRAVGCEPMICVNAGDGTPEEAAAWLEYCNGGPTTRYGRLRAENGHPEPYAIRYWEIGNELYGRWQIGHCTPEEYAERYERFHRALKAVDPSIHIIANGQDLRWNEPLVTRKGKLVEAVTIHTLIGGGLRDTSDAAAAWQSLMAYPTAYARILDALRRQMKPHVARPRIALTELQLFTNRPRLPNNQEIGEALFLAGTIHTAIRMGELVEMITHTATVNHGGGLRKEREIVYPNPVYFASKLYATQPGTLPVGIHVTTPTVNVPARHGLPGARNSPYLDAIALLDGAERQLVLLVVNRHHERPIPATVAFHDFAFRREVLVQTIRGSSFRDCNTWKEPSRVRIRQEKQRLEGEPLGFTFEPCSVTALTFRRSR
jgi:alpha-N-arabinofuranosidase